MCLGARGLGWGFRVWGVGCSRFYKKSGDGHPPFNATINGTINRI